MPARSFGESVADRRDPKLRLLIEAPSGYGKTRAVQAVVRDRALQGQSLVATTSAELCTALRSSGPSTVVIADNIESWSDAEQRDVAAVVAFDRMRPDFVLAACRFSRELYDALILVGARAVGMHDLRVGRDHAMNRLGDLDVSEHQLDVIDQLTEGWPQALYPLLDDIASRNDLSGLAFTHPAIVEAVNEVVGRVSGEDVQVLERVSSVESRRARPPRRPSGGPATRRTPTRRSGDQS